MHELWHRIRLLTANDIENVEDDERGTIDRSIMTNEEIID
jgi:hypothetical protein